MKETKKNEERSHWRQEEVGKVEKKCRNGIKRGEF